MTKRKIALPSPPCLQPNGRRQMQPRPNAKLSKVNIDVATEAPGRIQVARIQVARAMRRAPVKRVPGKRPVPVELVPDGDKGNPAVGVTAVEAVGHAVANTLAVGIAAVDVPNTPKLWL